jgi:uncharacterized coiled-coil protein SlyX
MKSQKQSRLDNLEKRMAAATNVLQQLIDEATHLRTLTMGNHALIKLLPGYDKALEELKKENEKNKTEKKLEI